MTSQRKLVSRLNPFNPVGQVWRSGFLSPFGVSVPSDPVTVFWILRRGQRISQLLQINGLGQQLFEFALSRLPVYVFGNIAGQGN